MFNVIKRLFGFGKRRAWVDAQRGNLRRYLTAELGTADGLEPEPVWTFDPYVALWLIPNGWAISDAVVNFHVVGQNEVLRSPRDAARYFARHFRQSAEGARREGNADIAESLDLRARALQTSVELDTGWNDRPRPAGSAERQAAQNLRELLAAGETDPRFGPLVRVIHSETAAPGGPFHGIYVYLDLRASNPPARVFDAVARQLDAFEARFAPLVAFRVQYALVAFGLNFGEHAREVELERQADQMLVRNPELARAIDQYSPTGEYPLALHFVNDRDVPFTAHPCSQKPPGYKYKPEDKFFDVRTHPFHKSLEASRAVGMRLVAGSIAPDIIRAARQAFANPDRRS